ncbi:MAG: GNAT family N-acetyltransferase [Anaerolineae bacterium]
MIDYRVLHSVEELKQVEQLEIVIWGLNPIDTVPVYVMHAAILNGGIALGAYEGERMVGMAFAFTAKRGTEIYLWSHMTGVHQEYQGKGLGYELKQMQRRWALNNGYETIRWTYDPLQRGNAHFNIALLGATANVYHENFYGDMDDDINRGLPSDRVEAEWYLPAPKGRAQPDTLLKKNTPPILNLIRVDDNGIAQTQLPPTWEYPSYFVPLPPSLGTLEREQRLAWRMAVRQALEVTFAQGYAASAFVKNSNGYIVERAAQ